MKPMPYQSSQTHPVLVRMMNNLKERNPELRSGALSSSIPKDSVNSTMFLNRSPNRGAAATTATLE
jgi:hypothetical protein